jgi:hypothetical protein
MINKSIKVLAILAGLSLVLAGMTFILWMPPPGLSIQQQALHLMSHKNESLIYLFSVYLSGILFTPIIILLTIKLFSQRAIASVAAASTFILAVILQTIATLASFSRWVFAIPELAKGDVSAGRIFETLQTLYLFIDIPGAILFYVAGIIYAVILWNLQRVASLLLTFSIIVFILGGAITSFIPQLSTILTGSSIIIYGIAYISIGDVTHRLFDHS